MLISEIVVIVCSENNLLYNKVYNLITFLIKKIIYFDWAGEFCDNNEGEEFDGNKTEDWGIDPCDDVGSDICCGFWVFCIVLLIFWLFVLEVTEILLWNGCGNIFFNGIDEFWGEDTIEDDEICEGFCNVIVDGGVDRFEGNTCELDIVWKGESKKL